jgi:hypothetical protein
MWAHLDTEQAEAQPCPAPHVEGHPSCANQERLHDRAPESVVGGCHLVVGTGLFGISGLPSPVSVPRRVPLLVPMNVNRVRLQ